MDFCIDIELKHEAGHNFRLKYEWLHQEAAAEYEMREHETVAFKEWQLLQIEGDSPVPDEEPAVEAVAAKGKKPAKPSNKKEEEIVDDRPRTVILKREVAAETGVGFKVTEESAS